MLFKKKPRLLAGLFYSFMRLIATNRQTNIGRTLRNEYEVKKKTIPAKITAGMTIRKRMRKESLIIW
jgi:hypothetical protein